MYHPQSRLKLGQNSIIFYVVFLVMFATVTARTQSTEIEYPTPLGSNQVTATIEPLDIGDPRQTHHYFAFTGTQGDLIITVVSKNLNGDVDIFTAGGLRPLVKISLYATESSSRASKTVFLHSREPLILRVEARTPNDDAGEYNISFGGGFEPSQNLVAEGREATRGNAATSRSTGTRRVTSVGATIEEPRPQPEPAATEESSKKPVTATPSPSPEVGGKRGGSEEAASTPVKPPVRKPATGRTNGRRPASGSKAPRTRPATEAAKTTPANPAGKSSSTKTNVPPAAAKQELPVVPSARLIVELKDGTRIEQSMGTIRRVTIDNGQIVVIHNNGRIERVPMTNVLRMAVEP
ncbi:MAG: hypothetical protein QOH96_1753 [Blastocatellia bacterium]|nr:hypothetical protein [Blastocatellia bacterium]